MEVELLRANKEDAEQIHEMQIEAFRELLDKYQDFDTSPENETVEKVLGIGYYFTGRKELLSI